ncbi:hypothetical protein PYCC9005_003519 [Savitreella phatthalungensis]
MVLGTSQNAQVDSLQASQSRTSTLSANLDGGHPEVASGSVAAGQTSTSNLTGANNRAPTAFVEYFDYQRNDVVSKRVLRLRLNSAALNMENLKSWRFQLPDQRQRVDNRSIRQMLLEPGCSRLSGSMCWSARLRRYRKRPQGDHHQDLPTESRYATDSPEASRLGRSGWCQAPLGACLACRPAEGAAVSARALSRS